MEKLRSSKSLNIALIVLWVLLFLCIISIVINWNNVGYYNHFNDYVVTNGDVIDLITAAISLVGLFGISIFIMNTILASYLIAISKKIKSEKRYFWKICGILMFFLAFIINCVIHQRLLNLVKKNLGSKTNNNANKVFLNSPESFIEADFRRFSQNPNQHLFDKQYQPTLAPTYDQYHIPNSYNEIPYMPTPMISLQMQDLKNINNKAEDNDLSHEIEQLEKIHDLKAKGIISDLEFEEMKNKILNKESKTHETQ